MKAYGDDNKIWELNRWRDNSIIELFFIKSNMTRNVEPTCRRMETTVTVMAITVANKNTLKRMRL